MKETNRKKKTKTSLTYRIVLSPRQRKTKFTRKVDVMNVQLKIQATTQSALQSLPANHLVFMKEAKINCT